MMNRLLPTALAALMFLGVQKASALGEQTVSDWVTEGAAQLRLVAGHPGPDGTLRAGLEIRLEPGWKTYWINPGPTGLPPHLDASGSSNLARIEPLWPLPKRFDDGGTSSVGYSGTFIVPLRIEPENPAKPVELRIRYGFGICEQICVPAEARLAFDLKPKLEPDGFAAAQLSAFENRVPKPGLPGDGQEPRILGVSRTPEGLDVKVRFPEGVQIRDLFASATDATVGVPKPLPNGDFRIKLKPGAEPKEIRLLMVADNRAVEVPVALDDLPAKP